MKASRPTIALACIMKNEEKNLPLLLESVKDCFDKIYITDTGSTDNSVQIAKDLGCEIHYFPWCDDFGAARNASFEPVKEDYVMWLDLDDSLFNKEAFIKWRDNVMCTADYWLSAYHYSTDQEGNPTCTFVRERCFKTKFGFRWRYFVHEGVTPESVLGKPKVNYVGTWAVKHRRTVEDLKKDHGRNLRLFEIHKDKLDNRMKFYYGKELFENQKPKEAIPLLLDVISSNDMEMHDRLLGIQYCCYAMMQTDQFDLAIRTAQQGVHLSPNRAEFYTIIGDAFLKKNQFQDALPMFAAAKHCHFHDAVKTKLATPVFNHRDAYTVYPRNQIARIYCHTGDLTKAKQECEECIKLFDNEESKLILKEIEKMSAVLYPSQTNITPCDDIVISCHPAGFYEWDWDIYKTKGIGGSETAAVEMAKHMHDLSGRPVKVFNNRKESKTIDGVEYLPASQLAEYFSKYKPYVNINWRHNTKFTDAKNYVWCHDIIAPGAENTENYEKILCLSNFHKGYVESIQGIPENKIRITRNGIDPERFKGLDKTKEYGKVVYRSSPDRGLDRALRVMDKVVKEIPEATFHIYYGFDNLYKNNMGHEADRFKMMLNERPWAKYHGNVDQKTLSKECAKAMVWLYPTDFTETSCISAMESLCEGVYPVVRRYGALSDTLHNAEKEGMATMLDLDCVTESEIQAYADEVVKAIKGDYHKRVSIDPESLSWKSLAKEWLDWMEEDGKSNKC